MRKVENLTAHFVEQLKVEGGQSGKEFSMFGWWHKRVSRKSVVNYVRKMTTAAD